MAISSLPASDFAAPNSPTADAFASIQNAALRAPLTELTPDRASDRTALYGFALAWAQTLCPNSLLVWAGPEQSFAEFGGPHAEGLAHYGIALERLLLVRTRTQADALWASEQALALPHATALCVVAPSKKGLSLTATRRLLLTAEKHKTRCILMRLDAAGASAARMRWRIAAAPSQGAGKELGPPAFIAHLDRNRAGPAGLSWRLQWNAHDHAFHADERALAGALATASADRSAEARSRRAL